MSTELASAYVQIIPSAKGISGSISSILEPEADKAGKSAGGKLGSALGTAAKVGAGAITAATAALAAGGAAFVKSSNEVAQYGDNVDKMSQKLGLSAKSYQEWDYVMQLAGTDMGSMTTGLKTLTNKLDDAKNGSDEARGMFEKLGISMEDINTMSREDLFAKTIEGFQGMADSTDRAALANDLFGKSGQNLAPLFNQSAEATKGLIEQANQYGMIMSGDAVKASADFEDALTRMQSTMTGAKNALIAEFLPSLTSMMDGVSMLVSGDKNGFDKISEGVDSLTSRMFVPTLRHVRPPSSEVSWNWRFNPPSERPIARMRPPPRCTALASVGHSVFARPLSTVRWIHVRPPSRLTSVPHALPGSSRL